MAVETFLTVYKNLIASDMTQGWQLSAGHYEPSRFSLEIIAPRAGLTTENVYYVAYPGLRYRLPVSVIGGAWPYFYEITSGPVGLTIGASYGNANYGIMEWTTPTTGTHSVTLRVTDQGGNQTTVTYTINCGTSYFIFVDAVSGNDGTADGTISLPYKTNVGWYGGTTTAARDSISPHAGKTIIYRSGTYVFSDCYVDPAVSACVLIGGKKPINYTAYPGESVSLDLSTASLSTTAQTSLIGFAHIIPRSSTINTGANILGWDSGVTDHVIFENTVDTGTGIVASNASFFFSRNNNPSRSSCISIISNIFNGSGNSDLMLGYFCDKLLFADNTISSNSWHGAYAKYDCNYWSIRNNAGLTTNSGSLLNVSDYGPITYLHLSYNNYKSTGSGMDYVLGNSASLQVTNIFSGRNTWQILNHNSQNQDINPITINNDVMVYTDATANAHGWLLSTSVITGTYNGEECVGLNGTFVTASGVLTGTYRTNYLGTRGHEIS